MRHTATAWSVSWVNPKPRVVSVSVCVYASLKKPSSIQWVPSNVRVADLPCGNKKNHLFIGEISMASPTMLNINQQCNRIRAVGRDIVRVELKSPCTHVTCNYYHPLKTLRPSDSEFSLSVSDAFMYVSMYSKSIN
jgi:hypothetical protein